MSDVERGFIAGIIEGDGSISLDTKNRKGKLVIIPNIRIHNTSLPILEQSKQFIGRGWIYEAKTVQKPSGGITHKKPMKRYCLENLSDVKFVLEQILDLLTSYKKELAEIVLEYCNLRIISLQKTKKANLSPYGEKEFNLIKRYKEVKR
jgi:hypothetical protein